MESWNNKEMAYQYIPRCCFSTLPSSHILESHLRTVTNQQAEPLSRSTVMGNANSIAPLGDVKKALDDPNTYVLDLRSAKEVAASGKVEHPHWSQVEGTAASCPELENHPERYVDDKAATVVIYCTTGRRAARAKQALINQGYTGDILNAGGYYHVKSIRPCFRL
jgi:rhodanese-related sulfurtransferase